MSKSPRRPVRKERQPPTEEPEYIPESFRFHEQARRIEERRQAKVRQLWLIPSHTRNWIFLRDIASWRAHSGTENPPNEARREDTYRLFKIALLRRAFFQDSRRSSLHLWNPELTFRRLTLEAATRFVAEHGSDLAGLIRQIFQWIVLPRRLARQWFEAEGWALPPWLETPTNHEIKPPPADVPPTPRAPAYRSGAQGRPTSINLIRAELGRRRNTKQVLTTLTAESEALAVWLADKHPAAPTASPKTIRNSLRVELKQAVEEANRPK
jgi:hypothetical protein